MKIIMQYLRQRSRKFKSSVWQDDEQILFRLKDENYRLADDGGLIYLFRESESKSELVGRFSGTTEFLNYLATIE
jgi:hypothetical protein